MTQCKLILPILAAVAMAGCVTTEQMPDGTTKIRFSDEAVSSMTSMMPKGVVKGLAGGAGGGDLDLIPTMSSTGSGQYLYLGGRFDYECTAALLYSAKSGKPLDAKTNDNCRQDYLIRQQEQKGAGKPYDRAAPGFNAENRHQAYWASLTERVISQLAAQDQFVTRFTAIPRYENSGKLTIMVGFLGRGMGQNYGFTVSPARTPVVFSDAEFGAQMRVTATRQKTDIGEPTLCEVALAPKDAVDLGGKPASLYASEYVRYQVRFTVASMSCKSSMHQFKNASE